MARQGAQRCTHRGNATTVHGDKNKRDGGCFWQWSILPCGYCMAVQVGFLAPMHCFYSGYGASLGGGVKQLVPGASCVSLPDILLFFPTDRAGLSTCFGCMCALAGGYGHSGRRWWCTSAPRHHVLACRAICQDFMALGLCFGGGRFLLPQEAPCSVGPVAILPHAIMECVPGWSASC